MRRARFHEANDASFREEGAALVVAHRFKGNLARSRPFIEFVLAMWSLRITSLAGAGSRLLRVTFAHEAPPSPERDREHFGVDVEWGATEDSVVLARAGFDAALPAGDPATRAAFEAHLARELTALPSESLLERVRAHVVTLIREGSADAFDVDRVSRRLGLSRRTLQRRLLEHDTSFRDLVDLARRDVALAELRRGASTVTDLAFLLGFSENSAFSRAFRRWTGKTPAQYARGD